MKATELNPVADRCLQNSTDKVSGAGITQRWCTEEETGCIRCAELLAYVKLSGLGQIRQYRTISQFVSQ